MRTMNFAKVEVQEHIATVSMTQPTMPPAFFRELRDVFVELGQRKDLRAIVLQSEAKSFTYGLDLPEAFRELGPLLSGADAGQRSELYATILELQSCFNAVADCPVPTIAAIHGHCIGGGIDLICCCDVRVCSADAVFSVRETRIAIVADLGTLQRLPDIVGQGHARELALTGKDIDAQRAGAIGLCNSVHADRETAQAAAQDMARAIAANSPLTVRGVKNVMDFTRAHGRDAGLQYVAAWNSAFLASADLGEAMSAFMSKRPPSFTGR